MKAKSILLVEDDPNDEELTLRAFQKSNMKNEIVVARDGADALNYLFGRASYLGRDTSALPQLVLLDLKLPKVDGFEVLKEIRSNDKTKHLPVVILSSSKEEGDLVDAYAMGANSYVRKPSDFVAFAETLRQLGLYWLLLNEAPPTRRPL